MYHTRRDSTLPLSKLAAAAECQLRGDATLSITSLVTLECLRANSVSLYTGKSRRSFDKILKKQFQLGATMPSAAVIVAPSVAAEGALPDGLSFLVHEQPIAALVKLVPLFFEPYQLEVSSPGVSPQAVVHPSVEIGPDVEILPFCWIGAGVRIGARTRIFPHVVVYPDAVIGNDCVLHSGVTVRERCVLGDRLVIQNGAVLGSDGFGYYQLGQELRPVPQVGRLTIADNVDIGANSCIDRATLGETEIGTTTKIDNLVQIGHNVKIGRSTIVCGQVGIAGSCTIGDGVVLGGAVGVADHLTIADGSRFAARSGVIRDHLESSDYAGMPAISALEWRRQVRAVEQLPGYLKKLRRLSGRSISK